MKNRKSMMERNRKANSKDVAKLAGVSQASVSRAFTPGSQISKANKEKILEAAKQLNYVPNAMARALISSHSNCIAIVQPVSKNPYFYAKVLQKLLELLQAENQRVVLFSQDDKNVDDILPLIDQYQVDGVIMASATVDAKLINQYANRGIEFSFINRSVPNVYASSVCTDNYQSTKDLITYLDSKGHKRFACIAGNKNASTTISRVEGYLSRIEELELENIGVLYDDFSVDSGYHSLLSLLENSDKRPDVVMCGNDEVAIGVINAIKEHTELNIPDDIAVTGFDDIEAAKWFPYSLTTIEQPINQLCEVTVSDLLERIRSPDKQPINMSIKGALIKRKTA